VHVTLVRRDQVLRHLSRAGRSVQAEGLVATYRPLREPQVGKTGGVIMVEVRGERPDEVVRGQAQIRQILELEIEMLAEHDEVPSRVLDAAGGYAPTIGIIGAILGLIHVMEKLADPSQVGPGIAVAFVATIYGVGAANLVLLPLATKLRYRAESLLRRRELLLEGAAAIQEGINPKVIEQRLRGFSPGAPVAGRSRPALGAVAGPGARK
jgi:chemotaxis protein MotA